MRAIKATTVYIIPNPLCGQEKQIARNFKAGKGVNQDERTFCRTTTVRTGNDRFCTTLIVGLNYGTGNPAIHGSPVAIPKLTLSGTCCRVHKNRARGPLLLKAHQLAMVLFPHVVAFVGQQKLSGSSRLYFAQVAPVGILGRNGCGGFR